MCRVLLKHKFVRKFLRNPLNVNWTTYLSFKVGFNTSLPYPQFNGPHVKKTDAQYNNKKKLEFRRKKYV